MEKPDRPLISILAYTAAFDWPLTLAEIAEQLLPAASLSDIAARLDALVADGTARSSMGLYAHESVPVDAFMRRIRCEKETAQKWRRMRRAAWWLQAVPYVRALLASGSLAVGDADADSDWDVFVVAKGGRLYSARIFLLAAAWLMRRLRTKHDATAPDKFCFNHYVTTDGLVIRHRSLYTARGIASLLPLLDPHGYLGKLRQANPWVAEYVTGDSGSQFVRRQVRPSLVLNTIRTTLEMLLETPIGGRFESLMRRWQQRRIEREPATHASGGRVVADDRTLEFHPRSFEAVVLVRYNTLMARHGLGEFSERDSGLTV